VRYGESQKAPLIKHQNYFGPDEGVGETGATDFFANLWQTRVCRNGKKKGEDNRQEDIDLQETTLMVAGDV